MRPLSNYDDLAAEAIERRRLFEERWFAVTAVLPLSTRVLWEEVLYRFAQMGVSHENPEVQAGMIFEYLMAEWLASAREHGFTYGPGSYE